MPNKLSKYYNYVYQKPVKIKKTYLKIFMGLLISALIVFFNNIGFLDDVINNNKKIFESKTYYALIVQENNSNYTFENLNNLGCATVNFNGSTILNMYINKDVCQKVQNNLYAKGLICNTKEIVFNSLYVKKSVNKQTRKFLKEGLTCLYDTLTYLINSCEQYDKNIINLNSILDNLNLKINTLNKNLKQLQKLTGTNLIGKIKLTIINSLDLLKNITKENQNNVSSILKNCTVNFVLNIQKILYN